MPAAATTLRLHPLSATLRIVSGLALLAAAAFAGWHARPPLAIAALVTVFAASFVVGRRTTWSATTGKPAPWPSLPSLLPTIAIQGILVGVLYLLGAGLAAVSGRLWMLQPPSPVDVLAPLGLGLVCAAMATLAARIDRMQRLADNGTDLGPRRPANGEVTAPRNVLTGTMMSDSTSTEDSSLPAEIRLLPEPVTPETFYCGIHFSHGHYGEDGFDGTATEASAGSDEKIRAAEARLGVVLPEGLRRLYRVQNGGSLSQMCIPRPGVTMPRRYDDILTPFSGYNDLYPTETLTTAWDSFLAFADPEDRDTYGSLFTGGTERMVVLAQWYRESLVLDYNQPGEPRVAFMDFDDEAWMEQAVWWQDFEHFFALLRHYDSV